MPSVHQACYQMNPNYAAIAKQDKDKLLAVGFTEPIKKPMWLSPIVVVPKRYGKLQICADFRKLNVVTKKDPYQLPIFMRF